MIKIQNLRRFSKKFSLKIDRQTHSHTECQNEVLRTFGQQTNFLIINCDMFYLKMKYFEIFFQDILNQM